MILDVRVADEKNRVLTVEHGGCNYQRTPCAECPWRKDAPVGAFPAEAYRISAPTSYDCADRTFGCHMAGAEVGKICAGFLLRGATHNLAIRLAIATGKIHPDEIAEGTELYESYRAMAMANGVSGDDPILALSRE